jgi:hypothetical protein
MEEGKGKLHFHGLISSTILNAKTLRTNITQTYSTRSSFHNFTVMLQKINDHKNQLPCHVQWCGDPSDSTLPDVKKYGKLNNGYPYLRKEKHNLLKTLFSKNKKPIEIKKTT